MMGELQPGSYYVYVTCTVVGKSKLTGIPYADGLVWQMDCETMESSDEATQGQAGPASTGGLACVDSGRRRATSLEGATTEWSHTGARGILLMASEVALKLSLWGGHLLRPP